MDSGSLTAPEPIGLVADPILFINGSYAVFLALPENLKPLRER
jgi:hypothetical protein